MKSLKVLIVMLVFCLGLVFSTAIQAQTKNLGMGAFANEEGPIKLAVDASWAIRDISSPYLMFIIYMGAGNEGKNIVVDRNGIVMIYQGKEYKMPTLEELRKNYQGEVRDITFYRLMGKEGINASWIRFYQFPHKTDFFPPLTMRSPIPVDEGSMSGYIGFRTKCYFKNPGIKKGDKIIIKVTAKNDPSISNEVEVVME